MMGPQHTSLHNAEEISAWTSSSIQLLQVTRTNAKDFVQTWGLLRSAGVVTAPVDPLANAYAFLEAGALSPSRVPALHARRIISVQAGGSCGQWAAVGVPSMPPPAVDCLATPAAIDGRAL